MSMDADRLARLHAAVTGQSLEQCTDPLVLLSHLEAGGAAHLGDILLKSVDGDRVVYYNPMAGGLEGFPIGELAARMQDAECLLIYDPGT